MNTLEMAKIYQTELDKQVVALSATGWMELNANQVRYNGGSEIKIPKMSMDGLGAYDRGTGFTNGSVTLAFETKTMTQDRGRSFSIDAMDTDETNFVATAGNVMSEFQRTQVVPEVDAYRVSKIASLAVTAGSAIGGYTPVAADILGKLKADIAAVKDVAGEVELVIMIATPVLAVLEQSNQVSRFLNVGTLVKGEVETSVQSLDGCPIVPVSSRLMKTAFTFNDGKTAGQEAGGFVAAAGAKNINWIIVPKTAPIAISKTDAIRIFDPMVNQDANAWKVDYRKYHDLFIGDNQLEAVMVNVKEAL
jgi:hypothetical protein